jgi:chromate transporter
MDHERHQTTREQGSPEGIEAGSVGLTAIFSMCFQIGFMSFGGMLSAWLYREVVERRRWLTPADFLSGLALGQVLPGINVANLSIYIGQRLRGVPGAAVALFGLLFAPFFIIIGLATVYARIESIPWAHNFLCGVATAAVGLLMSVALKSIRHTMRGIGPFVILAAVILTVGLLRWPMVPVVLCAAPISVALAWRTKGEGNAR